MAGIGERLGAAWRALTASDGPVPLKPSGVLPPGLPFGEGMAVGDLLVFSGAIGNRPGTLELASGSAEAEFRQVMENMKASLAANGLTSRDIVKCTVMLADMKDWPAFNEVYLRYFESPYPARSAFGTNGLAFNARVEMEWMAARPKGWR